MSAFKIGDMVWVPVGGLRNVDVTCPVCFGKCVVRLELGNGEIVVLPCEYCGKGYEGPRGVVREYTRAPAAEPFTITQIDKRETGDCVTVEYHSHSGRYANQVYATREEAMTQAEIMAAENEANERKRADYIKKDGNKNYSWNAGYHMTEARKAAEKVEWHTKMAQLCKAKAKEGSKI